MDWQALGAKVGIGACGVQVLLTTPVVRWGEAAEGRAILTGGQVPQTIDTLTAFLVQHWTTTTMVGKTPVTQHHYHVHASVVMDDAFIIEPEQVREYVFSLRAPWPGEFHHHWFVGARAAVKGGVDRGGTADFKLGPPRVFQEAAQALGEVCRLPVKSWSRFGQAARAHLPAVGEAGRVLDAVRMEIVLQDGFLSGRVEVNPQEQSAADVLRSLVCADRRVTPFRVPADNPGAAREAFESALRPHTDALRDLPIPTAEPGPAPESLPLPADGAED